MTQPNVLIPAESSRVVDDEKTVVLVGQPPEILKNLLLNKITRFDAMLLTDIKEKDGALLNNLEFPFYFFLFVANGLAEGRRLTLIGDPAEISQALRLLRITLMGPTRGELDKWQTSTGQKEEWLAVAEALAVKNADGTTIPVEDFFELAPFVDNQVTVGSLNITHTGVDQYQFSNDDGKADIDLSEPCKVYPPYSVQSDYVPGGLTKLGIEVLGGASGFTVDEPCTGLAVCHNGDYLLVDSIPFLNEHLHARGIAKNQVSALFLTHLHDDHCAMFPLVMMPHRVDVITTKEIFNMAMEKLACNLGWSSEVVSEHFALVEVTPGGRLNYYGLIVEAHATVHSIPTIGATFSMNHGEAMRKISIVGDNNSLDSINELAEKGIVREQTAERLNRIFTENVHLLIADGGAGAIHGDPADALKSDADRVVFVHVEELPPRFSNTFSLASAGKRYTVFEGDASIYTSQVNHYLSSWLGKPFPNRWMRSLLAQEEIRRYNANDVIVVQGDQSRGNVYLVLTGYCDVVAHDGEKSVKVAELQAGDLIGEMSIITGSGSRNASVMAATPVTICVFSEEIFGAFIAEESFKEDLLARWALRPLIRSLPQFVDVSSTIHEKIGKVAGQQSFTAGEKIDFDLDTWWILQTGELENSNIVGEEFGWCPLSEAKATTETAKTDVTFLTIDRNVLETLRLETPQLNYNLRKYRVSQNDKDVDWILGEVDIY